MIPLPQYTRAELFALETAREECLQRPGTVVQANRQRTGWAFFVVPRAACPHPSLIVFEEMPR